MDNLIKANIERIIKLYFNGYSVKEALEIIRKGHSKNIWLWSFLNIKKRVPEGTN